jgi:hypothetical protein
MKPQAGQLQIIQRLRLMNGIENLDATLGQILPDPTAPSAQKQFGETLVRKGLDHSCQPLFDAEYSASNCDVPPYPNPASVRLFKPMSCVCRDFLAVFNLANL